MRVEPAAVDRMEFIAPVRRAVSAKSEPPSEFTARHDLGIHLRGPLLGVFSTAHVLRNLGMALYRRGYDVTADVHEQATKYLESASYWGDCEVITHDPAGPYASFAWGTAGFPEALQERGQIRIATTDHTFCLGDDVLRFLSCEYVNLVLPLSPLCRETWLRAGVPAEKIAVWPIGIDCGVFTPEGARFEWPEEQEPIRYGPEPEQGAFVFLVAGYLQDRKGWQDVVRAYCQAFSGRRDVVLVLKHVAEHWAKHEQKQLEALMGEQHAVHGVTVPPIVYAEGRLREYDMAALVRSADCYVSAHRREGFGLIPLQAMASGTPAIIGNYHGPAQYARADNCYLLEPSGTCPAQEEGPTGIEWAVYELTDLQRLMVEAREGRDREAIVEAGRAEARQWTWQRSAEVFAQHVEDHVGYLRRRPRKWHSATVDYSLVVACRNGALKLRPMLTSLYALEQDDRREVLVLDDNSNEEQEAEIAAICDGYPIRYFASEKQLGICGARAELYERARGAWIVSLDCDLDFSETAADWLDRLKAGWLSSPDLGIVAPLLLWPQGLVWAAGAAAAEYQGSFALRQHGMPPSEITARPALCASAPGACHFFRADLLDRVRMSTVYYPAYYEDSDLCYQARSAGCSVLYWPEVRITHDAGTWTTSAEAKAQTRLKDVREAFHERWGDIWEDDLIRQDETGALKLL